MMDGWMDGWMAYCGGHGGGVFLCVRGDGQLFPSYINCSHEEKIRNREGVAAAVCPAVGLDLGVNERK